MRKALSMLSMLALLVVVLALSGFDVPERRATHLLVRIPFDTSGAVDTSAAAFEIDFDTAVAGTYVSDIGGYTLTVNGSPTIVTDGTWPAGLTGSQGHAWTFDGSTDYLSLADASGGDDFDPAGDFSVMVVTTPRVLSGVQQLVAKLGAAGDYGWCLGFDDDDVVFGVSDDGTNVDVATGTNAATIHTQHCIVAMFDTSASTGYLVVDEQALVVDAVVGPAFNGIGAFQLGAQNGAGDLFTGEIHEVMYFDSLLSEERARRLCRQWRGVYATNGKPVNTSSASPPYLILSPPDGGTQPFFARMPANAVQVRKRSSAATIGGTSTSDIDNLCQRAGLETWAVGSPTGWTETSAGGTSDAIQDTTNRAQGNSSASLDCDGTNAISLTSACKTISASTAYYGSAWLKTTAGTATAYVNMIEYTSADCTTGDTSTTLWTGDPGSYWVRHSGTRTTGGSVQSGQIQIMLDSTAATVSADAVHLRAGAFAVSQFCGCDTDATCVCSAVAPSFDSQINGNEPVTIQGTWSSPWAATSLSTDPRLITDGTGGANTMALWISPGNDEPYGQVVDSAGSSKYVSCNVANWVADTEYTVTFYHNSIGGLFMYWNSAWQSTMSGAGTGMRSASQTTTYIGSNGTIGYDLDWGNISITRGLPR